MTKARVLSAFGLAPGVYPLVAFIYTLANGPADSALASFLLVASFTYPIAILCGIPTLLLFRRMRWEGWWQYSLAGGGIGYLLPVMVALAFNPRPFDYVLDALPSGLPFLLIGMVSALVFWCILHFQLPIQRHAA